MDKKQHSLGVSESGETIDVSRRKLLGSVGKAAWMAPTLILLSSRSAKGMDPPQPPPPPCQPSCTAQGSSYYSSNSSSRRPKRRNGRG